MTTAVATAVPAPSVPSPRLFEAGGETLENVVLRNWDELVSAGRTQCPVCSGEMSAVSGCSHCGAELA